MYYDLYEEDDTSIENLAVGLTKDVRGRVKITHYVDMKTI